MLDAVSPADYPTAREASTSLRRARTEDEPTPARGTKTPREDAGARRLFFSNNARQAVVVVVFLQQQQQKKKKKKSSRFQLSPSAHPDVELLVHQGTDLVNREPVEVEKEEGKKMESRR